MRAMPIHSPFISCLICAEPIRFPHPAHDHLRPRPPRAYISGRAEPPTGRGPCVPSCSINRSPFNLFHSVRAIAMGDGDACEAALRGRRRRGAVAGGDRCIGGGGGGSWVSGGSTTSSLFSSTSSLTDEEEDGDGATSSSCRPDREVSSSSLSSLTSSGSETVQMGGAAGGTTAGPLYALSTMLEDLPALRTGLSKHYKGRSQSFTSLADVSCVEDLAKKTTPYTRRKKQAPRCYAEVLGAKNRLSKTIAKKAPRGKPPAYQGKREMYRC